MNIALDTYSKANALTSERHEALKQGDLERATKLWGEIVLLCGLHLEAAKEGVSR